MHSSIDGGRVGQSMLRISQTFVSIEQKSSVPGRTEKTSRQFRFHLIICRLTGPNAPAIGGIDMDETDTADVGSGQSDQKDLAAFGYKQELHRTLGFFSSFAAAFSYISPSTGIFTSSRWDSRPSVASSSGVGRSSPRARCWWPSTFAEVSSHFPVAGSVFQWTKYLAGRPYAWFTGLDLPLSPASSGDGRRRDVCRSPSCRC